MDPRKAAASSSSRGEVLEQRHAVSDLEGHRPGTGRHEQLLGGSVVRSAADDAGVPDGARGFAA